MSRNSRCTACVAASVPKNAKESISTWASAPPICRPPVRARVRDGQPCGRASSSSPCFPPSHHLPFSSHLRPHVYPGTLRLSQDDRRKGRPSRIHGTSATTRSRGLVHAPDTPTSSTVVPAAGSTERIWLAATRATIPELVLQHSPWSAGPESGGWYAWLPTSTDTSGRDGTERCEHWAAISAAT